MAYQGELDGLCGPYAIVNAYHRCGLQEAWVGQHLFNIACLAVDRWPNILWEGSSFGELRGMLAACQKELQKAYRKAGEEFRIEVEYPFLGEGKSGSNREYWRRFEDLFSHRDAVCGIVGMEHPHEHWIAFELSGDMRSYRAGGRLTPAAPDGRRIEFGLEGAWRERGGGDTERSILLRGIVRF